MGRSHAWIAKDRCVGHAKILGWVSFRLFSKWFRETLELNDKWWKRRDGRTNATGCPNAKHTLLASLVFRREQGCAHGSAHGRANGRANGRTHGRINVRTNGHVLGYANDRATQICTSSKVRICCCVHCTCAVFARVGRARRAVSRLL